MKIYFNALQLSIWLARQGESIIKKMKLGLRDGRARFISK